MGGTCNVMKQRNNGQYDKFSGPDCTDNFLIIKEKFNYEGLDWFSVEQAFQSLKFLKDSRTRTEIHSAGPRPRENSISYGERVWLLGQGSIRREDWELEKIKVMLLLNIAKYAANKSFQHDLVATQNYRIIAKGSTWKWTYWTAAIQTYVRQLIHDGKNLVHCLKEISEVHSKEVEEIIKKSYEFNAKPELYRNYSTSDYISAMELYKRSPPPERVAEVSQNTKIPLWSGQLVLCGVADFQSTFNQNEPDVVVTMCSKPPNIQTPTKNGEWLHRDFSGYDLRNFELIGSIIQDVRQRLREGKTVLIHCLDGQDRTGIVGFTLIRLFNPGASFKFLKDIISKGRPARVDYWFNHQRLLIETSEYNLSTQILEDHLGEGR
jgi:predicted NAD-dependent protein-ADP-ribosyltransferase YbiA (DUF1768 family)